MPGLQRVAAQSFRALPPANSTIYFRFQKINCYRTTITSPSSSITLPETKAALIAQRTLACKLTTSGRCASHVAGKLFNRNLCSEVTAYLCLADGQFIRPVDEKAHCTGRGAYGTSGLIYEKLKFCTDVLSVARYKREWVERN